MTDPRLFSGGVKTMNAAILGPLAVVLAAVVSGLVAWKIARRSTSGAIDTSEAATLLGRRHRHAPGVASRGGKPTDDPKAATDTTAALALYRHLNMLYGREVEATVVFKAAHGHTIVGRLTDFDSGMAIVTDDDSVKWECDPETVKAVQ